MERWNIEEGDDETEGINDRRDNEYVWMGFWGRAAILGVSRGGRLVWIYCFGDLDCLNYIPLL